MAWEDPAQSFPSNLWRSWAACLSSPAAFFRRISHDEPLLRPVLYYLLVSVAGAFFTLVWSAVFRAADLPGATAGGGGAELLWFFASPFAALVGLGLSTAVYHVMAVMLAPERRGPGATARALGYAASPVVFSAVPFLGPLVGMVWSLVLQVIGLREIHRTTTFRAAFIVLAPLAVAALGLVLLGVLAYMAMDAGGVPPVPGT